ncbi:hypothetical protein B296_00044321 [Ensete ventricosum]|uniref:Uncharacterized protein n=1 Tax=Ensete ventricosum TaxID=4639 RepID=A0A426Y5T1_ENSVE|nr:hypothetical protein B296_00044321 [Ensete ventricosum]
MTNEGGEAEIREAGYKCEGELDHHVIDATSEGAIEDEMRGDGMKMPRRAKRLSRNHCVPNIGLVNEHPPEAKTEAPELVVNMGEYVRTISC